MMKYSSLLIDHDQFLPWHNFSILIPGGLVMEGWKIIQQCELAPGIGVYGKRKFISEIEHLTTEEFNQFCRTYLHLDEFHTFAKNLYYTEDTDFIEQHCSELHKLADIDFDAPITYYRVK